MLNAYRNTSCLRLGPEPRLAGGAWKMSGVLGSSCVCLLGGGWGSALPASVALHISALHLNKWPGLELVLT